MKVAVLNREPSAYPGGDLVAINALIYAIHELSVNVTVEYIYGQWVPEQLRSFDLIHIFHCNFGWSRINFEGAINSKVPYVVTPVFYPEFTYGVEAPEMAQWLRGAKAVMPFSHREASILIKEIGGIMVHIIPNGTANAFHADISSENRLGVLAVSARDGEKNIDRVRNACASLGFPYVQAVGVPHSMMPAIYRRSKVFVNASGSERMSLTIGEALCSGCRVLATKHNWGNEWYPGLATIDPDNDIQVMAKIESAYKAPVWDYRPNIVAKSMTWRLMAQKLIDVYKQVLK